MYYHRYSTGAWIHLGGKEGTTTGIYDAIIGIILMHGLIIVTRKVRATTGIALMAGLTSEVRKV